MFAIEKQGAVDVIRCGAALQKGSLGALTDALQGCARQGQPHVVLDLAEAPLIDGKGLETLLDLQELCERLGGTIKLAAPTPIVEDVLRVTGVGDRFESYDTVKAAIGSYSR